MSSKQAKRTNVLLTAGIDLEVELLQTLPLKTKHYIGYDSKEAVKFNFVEVLTHSQMLSALVIKDNKEGLSGWKEFLQVFRITYPSCFIVCVHQHKHESEEDALLRIELAQAGVSMVTHDHTAVKSAFDIVFNQLPGKFPCTYCKLELNEDSLWLHTPFYHVNEKNSKVLNCPICSQACEPRREPYAVHLRNTHGPCGRGEMISEYDHIVENIYSFSLIVCTREMNGRKQMLLVQEFASSGFWLPGGRVDAGENLKEAAIRECQEEAGCEVSLTGVLQLQYTPSPRGHVRLRIVFFAQPTDSKKPLKSIPDFESFGATWVDFDTIKELYEKRKLRGSEPYNWAKYLQNGGEIHPISLLDTE
jgi:8-oxo-dGTP pyrophosphatase MutT (NUDIX family)